MAVRRPWTEDDTTRLRELHSKGLSCGKIAEEMGRSKATISDYALAEGLSWPGAQAQIHVAAATNAASARVRRAQALMAELEILELSQTVALRALRGRGKWKTLLRGTGGTEVTELLDYIPARDLRDTTTARANMAQVIDRLDANDGGVADGRSMLERLGAALGVEGPPVEKT